jgi:hypothetical protein
MQYSRLLFRIIGRRFLSVVFARMHASRTADALHPAGRTLFLANLPPAASADALTDALASFGEVERVSIEVAGREGAGGPHAHVVFADAASLKKCLCTDKALALPATAPARRAAPDASATNESREALQASVSSFMRNFERAEEGRERDAAARHGQLDEDGFVTVTRRRKGRNKATDGQARRRPADTRLLLRPSPTRPVRGTHGLPAWISVWLACIDGQPACMHRWRHGSASLSSRPPVVAHRSLPGHLW